MPAANVIAHLIQQIFPPDEQSRMVLNECVVIYRKKVRVAEKERVAYMISTQLSDREVHRQRETRF